MARLLEETARIPQFAGERTLVVYISDHGDFMGSHGLHDRKEHPHEEPSRIPALFHRPGHVLAQGPVDGLFGLVDLLATTCGLVGIDVPVWNQGTDFSPLLRGETFTGPEYQLLEMLANPRWCLDFMDWRALVTERWKYAYYETGAELLFDLHEDPYELTNLAAAQPEACAQWREKLLGRPATDSGTFLRRGHRARRQALSTASKRVGGELPHPRSGLVIFPQQQLMLRPVGV